MLPRLACPLLLAALLGLSSASCGGGSEGAPGDTGAGADVRVPVDAAAGGLDGPADVLAPDVPPDAAADVPSWPPFEPAVCDAPAYSWLPPEAVGGVVGWEPTPLLAELSVAQVNALIVATGEEGITVPYGARNFRLRYVTQDRGVPREATALVGLPVGLPAGARPPVLLYLHGTTGATDACAPSRDPANGPVATTVVAAYGFVVVQPDFLGMVGFGEPSPEGTVHPYLVGEPTAIASLDSVRAALAAAAGDPEAPQGDPARVILAGGSQGGHAVFVTERYAPYYAPELGIVAGLALLAPTDLAAIGTWTVDQPGLPARSFVAGLVAMWDWYGRTVPLTGALTEALAAEAPEWMAAGCQWLEDPPPLVPEETFAPALLAAAREGRWDDVPPWDCYLRENSPGTMSVPRRGAAPFLLLQGAEDELVPAFAERADVAALCAQGYDIQYVECLGGAHGRPDVETLFYLLDWAQARLDGVPLTPDDTCAVGAPVDCSAL